MRYIAILLVVLAILVPASVSADIEYFDGVPIDMPDDPVEYEKALAAIEQFGPPPPPPDWSFTMTDNRVTSAKAPATYKNQGSGPSIAEVLAQDTQDTIEYDWTGQEIWQYT